MYARFEPFVASPDEICGIDETCSPGTLKHGARQRKPYSGFTTVYACCEDGEFVAAENERCEACPEPLGVNADMYNVRTDDFYIQASTHSTSMASCQAYCLSDATRVANYDVVTDQYVTSTGTPFACETVLKLVPPPPSVTDTNVRIFARDTTGSISTDDVCLGESTRVEEGQYCCHSETYRYMRMSNNTPVCCESADEYNLFGECRSCPAVANNMFLDATTMNVVGKKTYGRPDTACEMPGLEAACFAAVGNGGDLRMDIERLESYVSGCDVPAWKAQVVPVRTRSVYDNASMNPKGVVYLEETVNAMDPALADVGSDTVLSEYSDITSFFNPSLETNQNAMLASTDSPPRLYAKTDESGDHAHIYGCQDLVMGTRRYLRYDNDVGAYACCPTNQVVRNGVCDDPDPGFSILDTQLYPQPSLGSCGVGFGIPADGSVCTPCSTDATRYGVFGKKYNSVANIDTACETCDTAGSFSFDGEACDMTTSDLGEREIVSYQNFGSANLVLCAKVADDQIQFAFVNFSDMVVYQTYGTPLPYFDPWTCYLGDVSLGDANSVQVNLRKCFYNSRSYIVVEYTEITGDKTIVFLKSSKVKHMNRTHLANTNLYHTLVPEEAIAVRDTFTDYVSSPTHRVYSFDQQRMVDFDNKDLTSFIANTDQTLLPARIDSCPVNQKVTDTSHTARNPLNGTCAECEFGYNIGYDPSVSGLRTCVPGPGCGPDEIDTTIDTFAYENALDEWQCVGIPANSEIKYNWYFKQYEVNACGEGEHRPTTSPDPIRTTEIGQLQCESCPAGSVVSEDGPGCTPCATNTVQVGNACVDCPDYQYRVGNATPEANACVDCSAFTYRSSSSYAEDPDAVGGCGTSMLGDQYVSSRQGGHVATCTGNHAVRADHLTVGNWPSQSSFYTGCVECDPDKYKDDDPTSPSYKSCVALSPAYKRAPNAGQLECPANQIRSDVNEYMCTPCPLNSIRNSGSDECVAILDHHYLRSVVDTNDEYEMIECGTNYTHNTERSGCAPCPYYQRRITSENENANGCEIVPADHILDASQTPGGVRECPTGQTPNSTLTECVGCPSGFYRNSQGMCTPPSTNGIVNAAGTGESQCAANTTPNATFTACDSCPTGTYRSTGMGSCSPIDNHFIRSSTGQSQCQDDFTHNSDYTQCVECTSGGVRRPSQGIYNCRVFSTTSKLDGSQCQPHHEFDMDSGTCVDCDGAGASAFTKYTVEGGSGCMELGDNWMRAKRDGTYIYGKQLGPEETYTLDGRQCPPHQKHAESLESCMSCGSEKYTFYGATTCQDLPDGFLPNMDGTNPAYGLMGGPEQTFKLDANNDPEKCPAHQIHETSNFYECGGQCPDGTYSSRYHDSCQALGPNQIRHPSDYGYVQLPSDTTFPVVSADGSITYADCPPHKKFDASVATLPTSDIDFSACVPCSSPGDMQYTSQDGSPCAPITDGQMRNPEGHGQVDAPPRDQYYDYTLMPADPLEYPYCQTLFRHDPRDPSRCIPDTTASPSPAGETDVGEPVAENVFFDEDGELVGDGNIDDATQGIQLTGVRECVNMNGSPPVKDYCPAHHVRGLSSDGTAYGEAISCEACTPCDNAMDDGSYYYTNEPASGAEPSEVNTYCLALQDGYSRVTDVYGAHDIPETHFYVDATTTTQCDEHKGHARLDASTCVPCYDIKGGVGVEGKTYFTYEGGTECEELSNMARIGYATGFEPPDNSVCTNSGDACEIPVFKDLDNFALFGSDATYDSDNNGLHKDAQLNMSLAANCRTNNKSSLTIRMLDSYVEGTCSDGSDGPVCVPTTPDEIPQGSITSSDLADQVCGQFQCYGKMADKLSFPEPTFDPYQNDTPKYLRLMATTNTGVFNQATNECVVTDCLNNSDCAVIAD